ncbi:hypothetical protein DFQ26_006859 [Actinomortierella ambigua]|nr:hypothetical protein DFQ26_006859 [Actinomortierella ambigua]
MAVASAGTIDLLLVASLGTDTDYNQVLSLVANNGTCVLLALPEKPVSLIPGSLILRHIQLTGSLIGSRQNTEETLHFATKHSARPWIEKMPMSDTNAAVKHMMEGKPRYHFVVYTDASKELKKAEEETTTNKYIRRSKHLLFPKSATKELSSLQSSLVLGNPLGSGRYGSVYEALWGCQQCAAKTFFLSQGDFHERAIQKEIELLKKLRHRNIVQLYRTHEQGDRFYLIMELAENGTLSRAIKAGTLDWPSKERLAHEIARGLEYIHQESVLHCDLKSTNVLLTKHMEAKLADFGLAQVRSTVSSSMSMSSAGGGLAGTLRWLAPELFEVEKPVYSTKTDIYALGMVMWEMAANCTQPFKDQDDGQLITMHVKSGHRERIPDDTPPMYREYIERCWHHDRDQRPDAREVILVKEVQRGVANDGSRQDKPSLAEADPNTASRARTDRFPQSDDNVVRYSHGGGIVDESAEDSLSWYHKAAKGGNAAAQLALGEMYEQGQGVDASDVEAANWYRKAAVYGLAKAQVKFGKMYEEGRGVGQDNVEAVRWFRLAAEQGQVDAQVKLAAWLILGRGVEKDDSEAVRWYTLAAEQGHANAQLHLAYMYFQGQGADQSDIEVVRWYTKAAEQGIAGAQFSLGIMYSQGRGVHQNHIEAVEWYTKAARQGHAGAQSSLGTMYSQGRGVHQNHYEAVKWYTKAAQQGHAGAQFSLGTLYFIGRDVYRNLNEAAKWYTKAAEQGIAGAQFNLGNMYNMGVGVKQSRIEAVKWYKKAAEQGNPITAPDRPSASASWVLAVLALGHLGVQFAHAFDSKEVVVVPTSDSKRAEAERLGATRFINSRSPGQMAANAGTIDLLLVTSFGADTDNNQVLSLQQRCLCTVGPAREARVVDPWIVDRAPSPAGHN